MLIRCIYVVEVDFICIFIRQILKLYSYGSFLNIIPPYFFLFFQVKEHVNSSVSKRPSSPYFTKPSLWLYCNMLQLISFCTQVSLFMLCLHCLHCYMAVLRALHSPHCDRGQWVLGAGLTSCCCNLADTPAGEQTDRRTDKTSERARCIYSLFTYASLTERCMAWYSLKANQYWICRAYNVESPRLISARLCPKYFIKSKYDRMQWCGSDLNTRVIWKWSKK